MKKSIFVFIVLAITLASCAKFTLSDSNKIQKGMAPAQVNDIVSKGPEKEFMMSIYTAPSKKYFVQVYDIQVGSYNSDYFAVYENDKLLYWGYPYEFNRHPDPLLNEIGKTAVAEYEKIK